MYRGTDTKHTGTNSTLTSKHSTLLPSVVRATGNSFIAVTSIHDHDGLEFDDDVCLVLLTLMLYNSECEV